MKIHSKTILWAALLLGILAPFGLYFALQVNLVPIAILCFGLLTFAMLLTAWRG